VQGFLFGHFVLPLFRCALAPFIKFFLYWLHCIMFFLDCQGAFEKFFKFFLVVFESAYIYTFLHCRWGAVLAFLVPCALCVVYPLIIYSCAAVCFVCACICSPAAHSRTLPRGQPSTPHTPFLNLSSNENKKNGIIFKKPLDKKNLV